VDHIVPVDIYLPGCPPRPEMLLDAIVKLHDKILNMKLGVNREREVTELEQARLRRLPLAADLAGIQSRAGVGGPTVAGTPALGSPTVSAQNLGFPASGPPEPARADARSPETGAAGE